MTSARLQSNHTADALGSSPVHSRRSVQSPAPTFSAVSQTSDQPLSPHDLPLTPHREPRRSTRNHRGGVTASPSPLSNSPELPASGGRSRTLSIHPDLLAIKPNQSSLSKRGELFLKDTPSVLIVSEFETVKSKIQADPNYLGEMPFIRLANPQYKIRILVHTPPERGSGGKWYYVSKGRSIGIFPAW